MTVLCGMRAEVRRVLATTFELKKHVDFEGAGRHFQSWVAVRFHLVGHFS
jgi:hypothetical protein